MNREWMKKQSIFFINQGGNEELIISNTTLPKGKQVTNSYWKSAGNFEAYNGWSRLPPIDVSNYDYVEIRGSQISLAYSFFPYSIGSGTNLVFTSNNTDTHLILDVRLSDYLYLSFVTNAGNVQVRPILKGSIKYQ